MVYKQCPKIQTDLNLLYAEVKQTPKTSSYNSMLYGILKGHVAIVDEIGDRTTWACCWKFCNILKASGRPERRQNNMSRHSEHFEIFYSEKCRICRTCGLLSLILTERSRSLRPEKNMGARCLYFERSRLL